MENSATEKQFIEEFKKFHELAQQTKPSFNLTWNDRYPCLGDKTATTYFDRHYIYHTPWAARAVAESKPKLHIDIVLSSISASADTEMRLITMEV